MESLKREQIPPGKVQIRKLDKHQGDLVELVDSDKVLLSIKEYEIIIDEDTKAVVKREELPEKIKKGETKRIRTVPPVAGGDISTWPIIVENKGCPFRYTRVGTPHYPEGEGCHKLPMGTNCNYNDCPQKMKM